MGCYDSTCAVTNIGIRRQEDVIMFECKSGRLYDLLGYVTRFNDDYEMRVKFGQEIADTTAKRLGRERTDARQFVTPASAYAYKIHGIRVTRGKYSHYGWIDGVDVPEELPNRFFVKASIADKITNLANIWTAGEAIVGFMWDCRLAGFSVEPLGSQHVDEYELRAHSKRVEYIQAAIRETYEALSDE